MRILTHVAAAALTLAAFSVPAIAQDRGEGDHDHDHDHAEEHEEHADDHADEQARGDGAADPALAECGKFIAGLDLDTSARNWKTKVPQPPKFEFAEGSTYYWILETNKGPIKIHLMEDVAPMHVSSTIYLTELGFYDDLLFHRVIPQFMAQGGCPLGTGSGGPAYRYKGEYSRDVKHDRPGLLSMANTGSEGKGQGGSDGSQFFLTFVPTPHLDGKHTIFGEVVEGMDVVKTLESFGSAPRGTTKEKLFIVKATIEVEEG